MATNACLDEMRRKNRRPIPFSEPPENPVDPQVADHVSDRLYIDQALDQLEETFRVIIVLRDVAELDYSEIAETLGIPLGTVRSRLSRARKQLLQIVTNSREQNPSQETS